jgi:hypothetical protein
LRPWNATNAKQTSGAMKPRAMSGLSATDADTMGRSSDGALR